MKLQNFCISCIFDGFLNFWWWLLLCKAWQEEWRRLWLPLCVRRFPPLFLISLTCFGPTSSGFVSASRDCAPGVSRLFLFRRFCPRRHTCHPFSRLSLLNRNHVGSRMTRHHYIRSGSSHMLPSPQRPSCVSAILIYGDTAAVVLAALSNHVDAS